MVKDTKRDNSDAKILAANIFSRILYKTNFSTTKSNQFLLSIDLLKNSLKRDLLLTSLTRLESTYGTLLENPAEEAFILMQEKGNNLFLFLIKNVCEDFLTKQYGYKVKVNLAELKQALYTKNIVRDTEILFQIPFYALLDSNAPLFRVIYYPIYNSASASFIEALIDNLVLEISNCAIYFIVLKFSSVYVFRQTLYKSKFLSLRNFERFKNNLSWQTRLKYYIKRPMNLYNNRYEIYLLRTNGIFCQTIYANRAKEIKALGKIPLLTIVFVELNDFLSGRLDEAVYNLTKGVRFTLTSVIGQFIGLVWRGIIDGLKK